MLNLSVTKPAKRRLVLWLLLLVAALLNILIPSMRRSLLLEEGVFGSKSELLHHVGKPSRMTDGDRWEYHRFRYKLVLSIYPPKLHFEERVADFQLLFIDDNVRKIYQYDDDFITFK